MKSLNKDVADLLQSPAGSASAPSFSFVGDPNTGIYSPGADQVGIATGGTSRIVVDASGNVNIDSGTLYVDNTNNRVGIGGITSPLFPLDVNGTIYTRGRGSTFGVLFDDYRIYNSTSPGALVFNNGSDRARLDSSGRFLVGVSANTNGGILQLSSGITFPATAVAASDVNTLDDYEEGTWTPTDGSGAGLSFTVQSCRYTKIGRMVAIQGIITYPVTSNTNNANFTSFPFTAADNIMLDVIYSDASIASFTYISSNTTNSFLLTPGFNITNATMSGKYFIFSGTYAI
jgi:hypothetical protein